jgi:hypothetical protein
VQHLGSRWGLQEGRRACWARHLAELEEELEAGLVQMVVAGVGFATCAILGFQSFQECEDGAGGDVASVGLVDETSRVSLVPSAAAVVRKRDAAGTATAVAQLTMRTECSTLTVASGSVADRRLAFHADHAVVTEQMLASLTVECGKRLGESPIGSSWQPP